MRFKSYGLKIVLGLSDKHLHHSWNTLLRIYDTERSHIDNFDNLHNFWQLPQYIDLEEKKLALSYINTKSSFFWEKSSTCWIFKDKNLTCFDQKTNTTSLRKFPSVVINPLNESSYYKTAILPW